MGEKEKLVALMKDVVFPAFPGGGLDVKVKNQLPEHGLEAIAEALIAAGVVFRDEEDAQSEWVPQYDYPGTYAVCAKCGVRCKGYVPNYKFCPECGRKMRRKVQ